MSCGRLNSTPAEGQREGPELACERRISLRILSVIGLRLRRRGVDPVICMELVPVVSVFLLSSEDCGVNARPYLTFPWHPGFVGLLDMVVQRLDRLVSLRTLEALEGCAIGIFGCARELVQFHHTRILTGVAASLVVILALDLPESCRVPTVAPVLRQNQSLRFLTPASQAKSFNHVAEVDENLKSQ